MIFSAKLDLIKAKLSGLEQRASEFGEYERICTQIVADLILGAEGDPASLRAIDSQAAKLASERLFVQAIPIAVQSLRAQIAAEEQRLLNLK